jgi:hypothetical protein
MNAMIMSALMAFGMVGLFGAAKSEPKKATDDCCAKRTEACCTPKPKECCEKKAADDCHGASKDPSSPERKGHRGMCGEKAGGSGCMK